MLYFYNTLSGKIEEFKPLDPGEVRMYNCGPTVYNYAHIGNLRSYVFADTLRRVLEYSGLNVKQVINITDVGHLVSDGDEGEDKISLGAQREGKTAFEVAQFYTDAFLDDLERLNIETEGTTFPRATEHIDDQIALIQKLEEKGYTYTTSDGVYFDTSKFPAYGKLGNINLKGLKEGARVEANPEKRNLTDFALWKFSPKEAKREMEWKSPWGTGFPGWHIECSAMSMKYLGESFDIHTGGIDHIPTHHQAEIAQSEAATEKQYVKYWLHNEHLRVNGQRISKSLGTSILLSELIEKGYSPLAYRYFLLLSHYRTPSNFTWEGLEAAETALKRLRHAVAELRAVAGEGVVRTSYTKEFMEALGEDLNTAQALAVVWKLVKDDTVSASDKFTTLQEFDMVLGLDLDKEEEIPEEITTLLEAREHARASKDYAESDRLRDQIRELGYMVEDRDSGQIVRKI